jgi:hypothetical protein
VALGLGASIAAYEAALRTDGAYPEYLRDADVAELVVNPSLSTERAEELIASTPGVVDYRTDDLLTVSFDDGAPRTQAEVDHGLADVQADPAFAYTQVRMSQDGRYTDQDRPVVHEGRMLRSGAREAFLSREAADVLGLSVGDEIPLAFWATSYEQGLGHAPDEIVEPIGRSSARVVGIGVLPDEVLVDELYPRQRVLVSPEVGAPFTCNLGPIGDRDGRSLEELFAAIVPPDCALSYRYFSLQIAGGDAGVDAVADSLTASFTAENDVLPEVMREHDIGYFLIPSATKDQREQVESSIGPAVTVLRSFALAAALATVVVATLAALRVARRAGLPATTWSGLGMTRRQRLLAVAIPLVASVLAGAAAALAIGILLSGFGPVASVGVLEPSLRLGLGADVLGLIGGVSVLFLVVSVMISAATVVRTTSRRGPGRRSLVSRTTQHLEISRGLGVRAATRGGGAGAVLVGSTVAVGVVLAGLVFTSSIDGLTENSERYGWPYDAAATVGFGYGGGVAEDISASLDHPEVLAWGAANLGSFTIEGQSIAVIAGVDQFSSTIPLPVIDGRLPETAEEIAVGRRTAQNLGIEVGQRVEIASYFGQREALVSGTVVLPSLGSFESDRAATGIGALLSEAFFTALVTDAELAFGLDPGSFESTGLVAFVGVDLADGVDPTEFLAKVDDIHSWDINGFGVLSYDKPVRPPAIADVAGMRRLPLLFGGLIAATMAGGYAISILVATRARRRELAILGALGCSPRQLAASVRWHALTVASVAILIGGPLGIITGRIVYRAFATDLGVVARVELPPGSTAVVIAATLAVSLLASATPARSARRLTPAGVLRVE